MKISRLQEKMIREFFDDIDGGAVRGRSRAQSFGKREIRSKKHNHLALKWVGLGNAYVLCFDGIRRLLYPNELNRFYDW